MKAYLDHNAAAPLTPSARQAMTAAMDIVGNPSSTHGAGRRARRIVEDARAAIAASTNAHPRDIVFTGSGTEACQLMIQLPGRPRRIFAASEHVAVLEADTEAAIVPVGRDGVLDLDALATALGADASDAVVAVMLANNETGGVQPIAEIARLVHKTDGALVVDAAQAYGKIPLDIVALGADALALSAAKIGGPLGVGAAAFAPDAAPAPILRGGGQERGLRGGSENILGIAGFGAAAGDLSRSLARQSALAGLRDGLEAAIEALGGVAHMRRTSVERLSNTASIAMPGAAAATQVMAFDLAGFAVSAGAACSSGKVERSHVLAAMGIDDDLLESTIRVSLGPDTTQTEIDGFVQAWSALYSRKTA